MTLPEGYSIVTHPRTKYRFVRTPWGSLIPNQGTLKAGQGPGANTDEEIVRDFYIWYRRTGGKRS